jgi:uncharacterized protein YfbU (UPF0304 family)
MDIFKLIFHHDQRMEQLAPTNQPNKDPLAIFTQPDPTYSTLYFSGTLLREDKFGLNNLLKYNELIKVIDEGLSCNFYQTVDNDFEHLSEAISNISVNEMILVSPEEMPKELIHSFSGKVLRDVLEKDWIVLFKREAKHGFDLQIFSKENIFLRFFYQFQDLLDTNFRFFSINGKRVHSEQMFYFETQRLDHPPHGFEEVFPESTL